MNQASARPGRLVLVSNRLPFNAAIEDGRLEFKESTGGLVTGLAAYLESLSRRTSPPRTHLWAGWPGITVPEEFQEELTRRALKDFTSLPVYLSEQEMEQFYHGFCNKTIWPLFHYFPTYTIYRQDYWQQYIHVNQIFCDALAGIVTEGDCVWIHDYHLMLLPAMLKARAPRVMTGFFLHIPFPSYEIFRLLPVAWRRQILEGILGADLIGFHTFDYTQHFLQSVLRILGYEHNLGNIILPSRLVSVDTFPMGIDYEKYRGATSSPEVIAERGQVQESLQGSRVVLSVDRLDYSKGILNRLLGFEALLASRSEFRGKVKLVMVVVPSRVMVEQYELMKKQIEELVGKINGRFGSISWTPVVYQYRYTPFVPLVALYSLSDVALITPLRDGMNLVCKEYVATRADGTGVLILSEMAGAAQELSEAIIINPNNTEEIAEALREALEMPVEEQRRRNEIMQARLRRYNVLRWANDFVDRLLSMEEIQSRLFAKLLTPKARQHLIDVYRKSHRRLLFLDYDGTLVPFKRRPTLAKPNEEVLRLLRGLGSQPSNTVVLISGRNRASLDAWFANLPVNLVAEHGIWLRENGTQWQMFKQLSNDWKPKILPILELYADRLPGSFVEEKEFSLVWHYRAADPLQSQTLAGEARDHLTAFTANIDVQVLQGSSVIELRSAGVSKGTAALHLLGKQAYDFVLAIGDDWTDEDLFEALPSSAWSFRVGITATHAQFNLPEVSEVLRLLDTILKSPSQQELR